MAKYRKKPIVIEAIQLEFKTTSQDEIIAFSEGVIKKGLDGGLIIPTLEGTWLQIRVILSLGELMENFIRANLTYLKKLMNL